ncbi:uncharacterized protein EpC_32900 [Erwinia pyrifoliae Ep1/96]|nr:uncharacterized protein EpC_32900 [Erwinia pyrifoliae Ep1/96]
MRRRVAHQRRTGLRRQPGRLRIIRAHYVERTSGRQLKNRERRRLTPAGRLPPRTLNLMKGRSRQGRRDLPMHITRRTYRG